MWQQQQQKNNNQLSHSLLSTILRRLRRKLRFAWKQTKPQLHKPPCEHFFFFFKRLHAIPGLSTWSAQQRDFVFFTGLVAQDVEQHRKGANENRLCQDDCNGAAKNDHKQRVEVVAECRVTCTHGASERTWRCHVIREVEQATAIEALFEIEPELGRGDGPDMIDKGTRVMAIEESKDA